MSAIYRRNIHPNPRAGTDLDGWAYNDAGGSGTLSREATGGPASIVTWAKLLFAATPSTSPAAIHSSPNTLGTMIAVVADIAYTASGYVYSTQAGITGVRIDISWYDSGGSSLSSSSSTTDAIAAATWEQRICTATAPSTAAFARVSLVFSGPDNAGVINNGDYFGATGVLLEQAPATRGYFDGSLTTDTLGQPMWLGTAHDSESVLMSISGGILTYTNTAEGGTNGTTVTTANSGGGSGTAFTSITLNGTLTFSNTACNGGSLSYYVAPTSASILHMSYSLSGSSYYSGRAYAYFTTAPTASIQFMRFYSGMQMGSMVISNGRKVIIQCNGSTLDIGTTSIPLNTWLRFELLVRANSGSGGLLFASVYIGDDTTDPIYSYVNTSADTGTTNPSSFNIGKTTGTGDWAPFFIDDIYVSDTTAIGPANGALSAWWNA